MKTKEFKSIKIKEIKEIKDLISKKKLELSKNQVKMLSGKEKNIKKTWELRKEIAQLLTIVKEKELIEKNIKPEEEKK